MQNTISLSLPAAVVKLIDERCGGAIPERGSGRRGGRAHYIRKLVYKDLGLSLPKVRNIDDIDLEDIDTDAVAQIDPVASWAVEQVREGATYVIVIERAEELGLELPRGGKWTTTTVLMTLRRAARLWERIKKNQHAGRKLRK